MFTPSDRIGLTVTTLCLAVSCATNPVTGERELTLMSEAREVAIGEQLDPEVRRELGVYEDEGLQQYVAQVGLTIAERSHRSELPWHFTIVDVPAVNAFALPGGYIYLTRGILAHMDDEAQLAGVLGHEIGHVTARHAVQAYTRAVGAQLGLLLGGIFVPATQPYGGFVRSGLSILFLQYSRNDERQADRLGAEYAASQGWHPQGLEAVLTTLSRLEETSDQRGVPNWLETHPAPADRRADVAWTVAHLSQSGDHPLTFHRERYLQRIEGLVFGENPEEGIIRGNTFVHPTLRFVVVFPDGWDIRNSAVQVVARRPGDDAYISLQIIEDPPREDLDEIAARAMRAEGYDLTDGALTRISGLEAYVGTYTQNVRGVGLMTARVAHIRYEQNVYTLGGFSRSAEYPRLRGTIGTSIRSFRPLSPDEAADATQHRIALYRTREGDSWRRIATGPSQGNVEASALAIMNGSAPDAGPRPGEHIKIVVGE